MTDYELLSARLSIQVGLVRMAQENLSAALSSTEPGKGLRVWQARSKLATYQSELDMLRSKEMLPVDPRPFALPDSCVKELEEHYAKKGNQ